jgi:UDP-glucuronate decarboxylase
MNNLLSNVYEDLYSKFDMSYFEDKDILLTGSTGNIIATLLDFFSFSEKKGTQFKSIQAVSSSGKYPNSMSRPTSSEQVVGDLTNESFIGTLKQCDVLIHAAGYAQPSKFLHNAVKTYTLNTHTTYLLSNLVRPDGRILFLSSSEVYSGLPGESYSENQIGTTNPEHPRAAYIEGKRGGETIIQLLRGEGRIQAVSARVSLVYGPGFRQGDTRVLNTLVEKSLTSKNLDLIDGGQAIRTYCFVSDALHQMFQILKDGSDSTYNLGGSSTVTILELAELIAEKTGSTVSLPKHDLGRVGAPLNVGLNLNKVIDLIGNFNPVCINQGLDLTIEWFRSELKSTRDDNCVN